MPDEPVKPEQWPPTPAPTEPSFGDTQALRWARKKFSGPALAVIGSLLAAFGGYVLKVESDIRAIQADLRDLKHDMPHGDYGLSKVNDDLSRVRESVGVLTERIDNEDQALRRIYDNLDLDFIANMPERQARKRRK